MSPCSHVPILSPRPPPHVLTSFPTHSQLHPGGSFGDIDGDGDVPTVVCLQLYEGWCRGSSHPHCHSDGDPRGCAPPSLQHSALWEHQKVHQVCTRACNRHQCLAQVCTVVQLHALVCTGGSQACTRFCISVHTYAPPCTSVHEKASPCRNMQKDALSMNKALHEHAHSCTTSHTHAQVRPKHAHGLTQECKNLPQAFPLCMRGICTRAHQEGVGRSGHEEPCTLLQLQHPLGQNQRHRQLPLHEFPPCGTPSDHDPSSPRPLRGLTPTLGIQIPEGPQNLPGTLKLENPFGTPKPPRNSKTLLGSQKPLWDAKRLLAPPPPPKPRPPADSTTPTARRSSAPCRSASATPAALATPTGDTSREAWPSVTWGRGHMRAVSVGRGGAMGKGWDQMPL